MLVGLATEMAEDFFDKLDLVIATKQITDPYVQRYSMSCNDHGFEVHADG